MAGKAMFFAVLLALSCTAHGATNGITTKQFFRCAGDSTLWKVLWIGVDKVGQADLMEGETNVNWSIKASRVKTPAGEMAPATNRRWYRVRSQKLIPFLYDYTTMCWVPQQRCGSQRTR